jgi:hypothetical protein
MWDPSNLFWDRKQYLEMLGLVANRKTKNNFVLKDEMRVAPGT